MDGQAGVSRRKRYVVLAGLVAAIAVGATALLALLMKTSTLGQPVAVRLDSPRSYRVQAEESQTGHLTMAIAPVINSRDSFPLWKDLSLYIGQKLSLSVNLMQRRTYKEVNELLERQDVEIGLICSGPYVRLKKRGVVDLLVVPVIRGSKVYHSLLIVGKESPLQSLDDLRGGSFAFTDPDSNSGHLYPSFLLHEKGEEPRTFFSRTIFTYGHDRSTLSVAHGLVDAAAVDSVVFEDMIHRRPQIREQLRVIHRSPPFGINPIVIHSRVSPALRDDLREVFLQMDQDGEGRAILDGLGIEAFRPGDLEAYKVIEEMLNAMEE